MTLATVTGAALIIGACFIMDRWWGVGPVAILSEKEINRLNFVKWRREIKNAH